MNRIKQISSLIDKCQCVYDVGSDHALLAIDLLKTRKVKQVVNIEKNWQPHNAGKANLAKNHLTTKTINVLNDGLKNITSKVFVQPNCIVIAGMGAKTIIDILKTKDQKLNKDIKYYLEANCDVDELRKYLAKEKWEILWETTCLDRTKFYQIICAEQANKSHKLTNFEANFGSSSNQLDKKTWLQYLKATMKKIEAKKLDKVSDKFKSLYKQLKQKVKK